jgi:hypothetical protein
MHLLITSVCSLRWRRWHCNKARVARCTSYIEDGPAEYCYSPIWPTNRSVGGPDRSISTNVARSPLASSQGEELALYRDICSCYTPCGLRHSGSPERDSSPTDLSNGTFAGFHARTPCVGKMFSVENNAPFSQVVRPRWARTGHLSDGPIPWEFAPRVMCRTLKPKQSLLGTELRWSPDTSP